MRPRPSKTTAILPLQAQEVFTDDMDPDLTEDTSFALSGSTVDEDNPANHRTHTIYDAPQSSSGDEDGLAVAERTHDNVEADSKEPVDETLYETSTKFEIDPSPADELERRPGKTMKESVGRETLRARSFPIETPVLGVGQTDTPYTPKQASDARIDFVFSSSHSPENSIGHKDNSTGNMSVDEMLRESFESTQVTVFKEMPASAGISVPDRPSDPVMIIEGFSDKASKETSSFEDALADYSYPNPTYFPPIHKAYVSEFAQHLFDTLKSQGLPMQALYRVSGVMADKLKGFATRLGLNAHNQIQRDIVYFTYNRRGQVTPLSSVSCHQLMSIATSRMPSKFF